MPCDSITLTALGLIVMGGMDRRDGRNVVLVMPCVGAELMIFFFSRVSFFGGKSPHTHIYEWFFFCLLFHIRLPAACFLRFHDDNSKNYNNER